MEELHLLRDFGVITVVAGVSILIMHRLNMPSILGYLIAGILVGPFLLPNPPVKDVETIKGFADLGLVLLLFSLGLEFGWQRIREVGIRVLIIGSIEISVMIAVGYQLGIALGWTGTEAIFLGAALSISSSAVLVKVLRDAGQLQSARGRLIVGILVVEDFAAVILLSLLSGVAITGTASIEDIGLIAGKLAIFTAVALVGGALLVPRFIKYVSASGSGELLLIVGLALALGMALLGEQLGLSAAAGAFLIGAVLGDTEEAEDITHRIGPVRDIFAALFFVSIGMLIDFGDVANFIVPAFIATAVFIGIKIVVPTLATFFTGQDGETSLSVGFGMPQVGEFSLAIVKVGADYAVVSALIFPVVTLTTLITAVLYPFIFKASDRVSSTLNSRSPQWLRAYIGSLTVWLTTLRRSFALKSPGAKEVQGAIQLMFVNLALIAVVLGVGAFVLRFSDDLSSELLSESVIGLLISGLTVALCIPSIITLWKQTNRLSKALPPMLLRRRRTPSRRLWQTAQVEMVVRNTFLIIISFAVILIAIPFIWRLLSIGTFAAPLPVIILVIVGAVLARSILKLHGTLEGSFTRTFFGDGGGDASETGTLDGPSDAD